MAISDAIRGEADRFYREVGGALFYTGSGFIADTNAISRPQNIDSVTTNSQVITIVHEEIDALRVVEAHATIGENLSLVGIYPIVRAHAASTEILLRQDRRLNDSLVNTGTAWTKERGLSSPFTATGLTNASDDFAAVVAALPNLVSSYRLSEASGAVLDDVVGANNGAVVGSGATYEVTGGLGGEPGDKAITTTGISTNELTFPTTGITQAAMSIVMRLKLPFATKIAVRDNTGSVIGTGYFVGSNQAAPIEYIQYRAGNSASTYTTATPWSSLADGTWHTLVFTKSGATVALYLDDELIHTAATAGSTAITTPWHVGRNGNVATYYAATLSEFVNVARALTLAEVRELHGTAVATGLLHIAHIDLGSTRSSEISLTQHGDLRPVLVPGSVTAAGFDLKFLDDTGTEVEVASTDMAVGITRDVRDHVIDPTDLAVSILVTPEDDWVDTVEATSPTLWARLGEASGTSFNDEIGTNDGTSQATVTLGATGAIVGDSDDAVTFDGTQGKIGFANPALIGSFSISIWFKNTGPGTVGNTTYGTIMGWGTGVSRRILVNATSGLLSLEMGGAIATAAGATNPGEWNHMVVTWDGTTQKAIVNGQVVIESATANISLNAAFFLGSYLATSTSYSFKGDMDELIVWDRAISLAEAQQLYVTGANTGLQVDRSDVVQINFRGLFETSAPVAAPPPDQEPPVATPLPAGDQGGAATNYISLAPYRADLNSVGPAKTWIDRALPATQPGRDAIELNGLSGLPAATSDNWRTHFCTMVGVNPVTGAAAAPTQGTTSNSLYMRIAGENIYVVSDTQPVRTIDDLDTTVSGWAADFEAAQSALGGCPIPADARPHVTGDRYAFVYQPTTSTWFTLYGFQPLPAERAATTIELTGSPSNGGFFLEFDVLEPVLNNTTTFFLQGPVPYNCTASQLQTLIFNSKTTAGLTYGSSRSSATPVLCTGGPLNLAPIETAWVIVDGLQPVGMRFTNNFMNSGAVNFVYENAEAWTGGRVCSVTSPTLVGEHQPSGGTAAATGIDWLPMVVDWDEYQTAFINGTGLGHVIALSIGNCGTGFVYPAIRSDGTLTNTDGSKIKQGALMTFPLNADDSNVSPEMMPLFKTIQEHGLIPIDKTGGGAEIIFRNWQWPGESRPFPGPATLNFTPLNRPVLMRQLPWHQLQIIDPAAVLAGW